jgi:hypothetical protein
MDSLANRLLASGMSFANVVSELERVTRARMVAEEEAGKAATAARDRLGLTPVDQGGGDDESRVGGRALISALLGRKAGLAVAQTGFGAAVGEIAGPVVVGAEVLGKLAEGLKAASKTMDVLGDSTKTAEQKLQTLAGGIPLIGGLFTAWFEFTEALSGTTDRMRRNALTMEVFHAALAVQTAGENRVNTAKFESEGAINKWEQLRDLPGPVQGATARESYLESIAYKESQARIPAAEKLAEAQAATRAARHTSEFADQNARYYSEASDSKLGDLRGKRATAARTVKELKALEEGTGGIGGISDKNVQERVRVGSANTFSDRQKAELDTALSRQQQLDDQIKAASDQKTKAVEQQTRATTTLAEAESKERQASIESVQVELSLLRQKEERLVGAAGRIGAMHPAERTQALALAKLAHEQGVENFSPLMRQKLREVAPEWLQKEEVKTGQNDRQGLFKGLQDFGMLDKGTIKEVRKEEDTFELALRQHTRLDKTQLAHDLAKPLYELVDVLKAAQDQAIADVKTYVRTGQAQKANR